MECLLSTRIYAKQEIRVQMMEFTKRNGTIQTVKRTTPQNHTNTPAIRQTTRFMFFNSTKMAEKIADKNFEDLLTNKKESIGRAASWQ